MSTPNEMMECQFLCVDLLLLYGNNNKDLDLDSGRCLFSCGLTIALESHRLNLDIFTLVQTLAEVAKRCPEVW